MKLTTWYDGATVKGQSYAGNRIRLCESREEGFQYENTGLSVKFHLRGLERYEIDGRRHQVHGSEWLLVEEGQQVEYESLGREGSAAWCIYFDRRLVNDTWNTLAGGEAALDAGEAENWDGLFFSQRVFNLKRPDGAGCWLKNNFAEPKLLSQKLESFQEEVFFELLERILASQFRFIAEYQRLPFRKLSTRKELYRRLSLAKDFLEDNVGNAVSLEKVSREAALSRCHLIRSFKKAYKVSPYQYLLRLRMKKASRLLRLKGLSVTEIAAECGYEDLNSFDKAFRNYYGKAPTDMRKEGPFS